MTKNSKNIFQILIENAPNRIIGEKASKKGRDYEDKVSYIVITRFNKIFKVKSKINEISFNGLEDLDIFDNRERIFSIQIKSRKHVWQRSDQELLNFLENCINRLMYVNDLSIDMRFYFFTNITGNFLEDWIKLHKEDPDKLFTKLPARIKKVLKDHNVSPMKRNKLFSDIYFLTGQKTEFLDPYIDESLLIKFKKFKNGYNPGKIISFIEFSKEIFHEKRLENSRVYEPSYENDILISNIMDVTIKEKELYCGDKRKDINNESIIDFLRKKKIRIAYLPKYNKIYCFHKFDKKNPLTNFIDTKSTIQKIELDDLKASDQIQLLNDWLYNYLNYIGLRYYGKRHRRYFYFISRGNNKDINWYDNNTRKVKEWKVVKKTKNFYENFGAEIRFRKFNGRFLIIINPRLFFSIDGVTLLSSNKIRDIEKTYRKSFMKNDFLRRRLFALVSYIRGDSKNLEQQKLLDFNQNGGKYKKRIIKPRFFDKDLIEFNDLITLEANFKPNSEAESLSEIYKSFKR